MRLCLAKDKYYSVAGLGLVAGSFHVRFLSFLLVKSGNQAFPIEEEGEKEGEKEKGGRRRGRRGEREGVKEGGEERDKERKGDKERKK